jgi:hypothetical protein
MMRSFLRVVGGVSFLVVALIVGVKLFSHATPGYSPSDQSNLENPEGTAPIRSPNEGKDALATAMESGRIDFQKSFATLDKTTPNLRWSDDQIDASDDSQESATLVTPYGPCIDLVGNTTAGYSLLFVGNYYHDSHGKGTLLGVYQDGLTAIHAAEDDCHKWYIAERNKPPNLARDSHMWFSPEEDTASPMDQVPATPVSTSAPADPSQSLDSNPIPAPIVRQPPPQD